MNYNIKNPDYKSIAEYAVFKELILNNPTGILSIVSDTFDLFKVITEYLPRLKDEILKRDGKIVIRPDSGIPGDIICGTASLIDYIPSEDEEIHGREPYLCTVNGKYYVDKGHTHNHRREPYIVEAKPGDIKPETQGVIELLWDLFGGTINSQGYKVLDPHIGVIYGDAITLERAEDICARLEAKGFASTNVVLGIGSFCVHPDTLILCEDFQWRKAGILKIGETILSFNEDPIYGKNNSPSRKYTKSKITSNNKAQKESLEIEVEGDAPNIKCSIDHPFLVWGSMKNRDDFYSYKPTKETIKSINMPRGYGLIWKNANELIEGDEIAFFGKPWKYEESRTAGWLEGMYDGEGSLYTGKSGRTFAAWKVNISQNEGDVLNKLRNELDKRNFKYYENKTESGCVRNVLKGGFYEHARFLGTINPIRLINKGKTELKDLPALKKNYTYSLVKVKHIKKIGISDVASITTSNGTFITNGFLSHNTYQYNTRDTFGFAMKATFIEREMNYEKMFNAKPGDIWTSCIEGIPIFKDPITDPGGKKSAKGLLQVRKDKGKFKLYDNVTWNEEEDSYLELIYLDGKFLNSITLTEIRRRISNNI